MISILSCSGFNVAHFGIIVLISKVYLVGGAPRVGKTTVALEALERRPMLVTSTDAMRSVLRGVLPEQQNPGLYALHRHGEEDAEMARYLKEQLGQALKEQKEEIMAVWKSVRDYIEANAADGRDVLVEGIHILPEFVKDLHGHDCRVVFLGNQSPAHDAAVRLHAKENTTDWIGQHSEGVVSGWIRFAQAFSIYIEKEAQKHSLPYVAMGDGDTFESSVRESIHLLFDV